MTTSVDIIYHSKYLYSINNTFSRRLAQHITDRERGGSLNNKQKYLSLTMTHIHYFCLWISNYGGFHR